MVAVFQFGLHTVSELRIFILYSPHIQAVQRSVNVRAALFSWMEALLFAGCAIQVEYSIPEYHLAADTEKFRLLAARSGYIKY
jgi:hypothetical protein